MSQPDNLRQRALSGIAPASGIVTLELRPASTLVYIVAQVAVESNTVSGGAACAIRLNGNLVCPVVPTADAAEGFPSIEVQPTDVISAVFTGLAAGDRASATFYYWQAPSL
jgi:hypothetical protein